MRKQGLGLTARRLPLVLEPDLSKRRVGPRSLASVLRDICWQARLFSISIAIPITTNNLPDTAQNSKTTSSAFKEKSFINFYNNKKKKVTIFHLFVSYLHFLFAHLHPTRNLLPFSLVRAITYAIFLLQNCLIVDRSAPSTATGKIRVINRGRQIPWKCFLGMCDKSVV